MPSSFCCWLCRSFIRSFRLESVLCIRINRGKKTHSPLHTIALTKFSFLVFILLLLLRSQFFVSMQHIAYTYIVCCTPSTTHTVSVLRSRVWAYTKNDWLICTRMEMGMRMRLYIAGTKKKIYFMCQHTINTHTYSHQPSNTVKPVNGAQKNHFSRINFQIKYEWFGNKWLFALRKIYFALLWRKRKDCSFNRKWLNSIFRKWNSNGIANGGPNRE